LLWERKFKAVIKIRHGQQACAGFFFMLPLSKFTAKKQKTTPQGRGS
jgi:hypothetical protein